MRDKIYKYFAEPKPFKAEHLVPKGHLVVEEVVKHEAECIHIRLAVYDLGKGKMAFTHTDYDIDGSIVSINIQVFTKLDDLIEELNAVLEIVSGIHNLR